MEGKTTLNGSKSIFTSTPSRPVPCLLQSRTEQMYRASFCSYGRCVRLPLHNSIPASQYYVRWHDPKGYLAIFSSRRLCSTTNTDSSQSYRNCQLVYVCMVLAGDNLPAHCVIQQKDRNCFFTVRLAAYSCKCYPA